MRAGACGPVHHRRRSADPVLDRPLDGAAILGRLEQPKEADQTGLAAHLDPTPSPERLEAVRRFIPQAGEQGLRLLGRVGRMDPTSLGDYLANGGYRALKEATLMGPERVILEIITADVLGRGGAAFPAGQKWAAVGRHRHTPRTSCATRTRPSRVRSRIARSSRRTHSGWWRR